MQEGWGRRYALLSLDNETLTRLLEPVASGHAIVSAETVGGGLVNTNYRVSLSGWADALVVRLYTRERSACHLELDIFQLAHSRVPMPEVLYADPEGERCGRPYMVTRWVEGQKLDRLLTSGDSGIIAAAAAEVGRTLAMLAAYSFDNPGFFGPGLCIREPRGALRDSTISYVRSCLFEREAGQRLGNELAGRVWELLAENATLLDEADGPATLVHGDYKAQNILLRRHSAGGWEMAAVLDWEFAMAGNPLFDLSILLRYAGSISPAFEEAVVAGYRDAGGRLPRQWKRVIKLLDLRNLCEFLCGQSPRAAMIADVTQLIAATIDGWDSYCSSEQSLSG